MGRPLRTSCPLGFLVVCVCCVIACSSVAGPEKRILGKWESQEIEHKVFSQQGFEFLADGSVAENVKLGGHWEQRAGSYKFIDGNHVKIDLGVFYGTSIYEVIWSGKDKVTLRAAEKAVEYHRVK